MPGFSDSLPACLQQANWSEEEDSLQKMIEIIGHLN